MSFRKMSSSHFKQQTPHDTGTRLSPVSEPLLSGALPAVNQLCFTHQPIESEKDFSKATIPGTPKRRSGQSGSRDKYRIETTLNLISKETTRSSVLLNNVCRSSAMVSLRKPSKSFKGPLAVGLNHTASTSARGSLGKAEASKPGQPQLGGCSQQLKDFGLKKHLLSSSLKIIHRRNKSIEKMVGPEAKHQSTSQYPYLEKPSLPRHSHYQTHSFKKLNKKYC